MGLLLIAYGSASLWTGKASAPARAGNDSPYVLDSDPAKTLRQSQRELTAAPASAYRWMDLAEAEVNANNLDLAKFSIRQALSSAPGNPAILFRSASLYLRLEDYDETLGQLTSVLRNPELSPYFDRVFNLYSQMDLPFPQLLNRGVPHTPEAANAFLRFWIKQGKVDEADETWRWICSHSLDSRESAGAYVSLLARQGRWEEAESSWLNSAGKFDVNYRRSNFVYNGSFELDPADSAFDWRLESGANAAVTRDTQVSEQGRTSLRCMFTGTPAEPVLLAYQTVLVDPGTWELDARMRTGKLTSSQGAVVRIFDPRNPKSLDAQTSSIEGTEGWTTVSARFEVKAGTRMARLEILRPSSRQFDSRLSGTAWIDAVELKPVAKYPLLKSTRLSQPGQPCEDKGDCRVRQATLQNAAQ